MRLPSGLVVLILVLTACSAAPSPPDLPTGALEVRAWTTQALPPPATFGWGPTVTITDGLVIVPGGVPAIYPGPLLAPLLARPITPAGQAAIVERAAELGLLGSQTDFSEGTQPGGITGHVALRVGDTERELTGDPNRVIQCITTPCDPAPGTPEAFGTFFSELGSLGGWLGAELEPEVPYEPTRLAVLVTEPVPEPDLPQPQMSWPIDTPLAEFGEPFPGVAGDRCGVVEGNDLASLLPLVRQANQLTPWTDGVGPDRALVVRALVPGEPDPCGGP